MELKEIRAKVRKHGSREDRITLAEAYLERGRIMQHDWRNRTGGREYVCALAAFGPDINDSRDCPADLMPDWLADAVPSLDDGLRLIDTPTLVRGLVDRARRWHVLSPSDWKRVEARYDRCNQAITAKYSHYGWGTTDTFIRMKALFNAIDIELEAKG